MFNKKKIEELEKRISDLEKEIGKTTVKKIDLSDGSDCIIFGNYEEIDFVEDYNGYGIEYKVSQSALFGAIFDHLKIKPLFKGSQEAQLKIEKIKPVKK